MQLPPNADLKHLKNQAKQLLVAHQNGDIEACTRFKNSLPRLAKTSQAEIANLRVSLQETQCVIAKEYGYANWSQLSAAITTKFDNVLKQYADASNLGARKSIHENYSTNKQDYGQWVFDFYTFPKGSRILELGCGPAYQWRENAERIDASWNITLSDISPGMLQDAQQNLANIKHDFTYQVINAQSIPFEDETFDIIIANAMLYHVPNLKQALSEIRRTLKTNGFLYATCGSLSHMKELWELTHRFDPNTILSRNRAESFGIENGEQHLKPFFNPIKLHPFLDSLIVPNAKAIVDYVISTNRSSLAEKSPQKFLAFVDQEIALNGAIHITKGGGLFVAKK